MVDRKFFKPDNFNTTIVVPEGTTVITSIDDYLDIPYSYKSYLTNILISGEAISARVRAMAKSVAAYYGEQGIDEITVLQLNRGAQIFSADFRRELYRCGGPRIKFMD